MRTLLLAALLLTVSAQAAAAASDAPLLAQAGPSKASKPADDDDDDAAPGKQTPVPSTAPAANPNLGSVAPPAPPANANEQKLVSGAPLYNPNVAVHIVEQKAHSDLRKFEVVLFPGTVQVNGKFTQHYGSQAEVLFHLQENFGLFVNGYYNWVTMESGFNAELIDKVQAQAQAATSLLNTWGALGGVEVTPFYGKFVWFENSLVHFSVVLSGGAGIGGTRHQLKPITHDVNPQNPSEVVTVGATFGDTGARFLGTLGGGFRAQFGQLVALRLELRDVVYTAKVDRVNGCDSNDLRAMRDANNLGKSPGTVNVSGSCGLDQFVTTEGGKQRFTTDVPLTYKLVETPSSDVLNNLGLYLGLSLNF